MKVGTKELKNRLSHYLRRVRGGDTVYVTDRDEIVAEIRGTVEPRGRDDERLRELAAIGVITLGRGRLPDFEPLLAKKRARLSDAVVEDRV